MDGSSPYCPRCGGLNVPDAAVCFACGESLLAAPAPSATPTAAASRSLAGTLLPNTLLRQRYQILAQIGEGGFGAVYKARDAELGHRLVAIKEMNQSGLASQELREAAEAFHREANLLAGLSHPSLPRIYDHFSEDGHWYLVMEFIEGETLERRLERAFNRHLPVKESLELAIQLCKVLEYLHTRQPPIIFRDLKPSNVMLTSDGSVYLIDFGIARLFKPEQRKDTMAFGSPGYAAPEQYGKAQTTPRSDVFSLGALLHQMLTGNEPSDTPFRFAPLTMPRPAGLGTFISQMVSLDELKRPPSMGIVRRELERLAGAWAAGQRGTVPTTALPPYQSPTGFFPAVRAPQALGAMPAFQPPHPAGFMPPVQPTSQFPLSPGMVSSPQATGAMRPAGPLPPYPLIPPVARPARARRRLSRRWVKVTVVLVACMLLALILVGLVAAGAILLLHHPAYPVPAIPRSGNPGSIFALAWLSPLAPGIRL
jgi:serine/threonine protein kinase